VLVSLVQHLSICFCQEYRSLQEPDRNFSRFLVHSVSWDAHLVAVANALLSPGLLLTFTGFYCMVWADFLDFKMNSAVLMAAKRVVRTAQRRTFSTIGDGTIFLP